jgi:hypothetical protein
LHQANPKAADDLEKNQRFDAPGQATADRADTKEHQGAEVEGAMSDQAGEPSDHGHHHGLRNAKGGEDPLGLLKVGAQAGHDLRQDHVCHHDRNGERHHAEQ